MRFTIGSVVSLTPAEPGHLAEIHYGPKIQGGVTGPYPLIGWAVVVTGTDDDGSMSTEIVPALLAEGVVILPTCTDGTVIGCTVHPPGVPRPIPLTPADRGIF